MKQKNNLKAWLYLLPAILFLGVFMVYPLIDVLFYSVEENYHSISQTYTGIGLGNFGHVLSDPFFIQALKNTLILVVITVPVSTGLSLLIALGLSSIKKLKKAFQTIYFLPYVCVNSGLEGLADPDRGGIARFACLRGRGFPAD